MDVSRRAFLKNGGVAMIGMSTLPAFLRRAIAATPASNRKKLVVLFQRGAADGLNIVVPFAEPNYYRIRPTIAIPAAKAGRRMTPRSIWTDFSACIPSLAPLAPLFQKQQLAIVHAAGSPDTTRSHFDAQDYMESGTPGVKATDDGWLNRALTSYSRSGRLAFPRRGHGAESAADAARFGSRHCAAGYQAVSRVRAVAGGGRRVRGALRATRWIRRCAARARRRFEAIRHAAQGRSRRDYSPKMARNIRGAAWAR